MEIRVNPTRMELNRLKRRLKMAERATSCLKTSVMSWCASF